MRRVPILMYHWFREAGVPSTSRSPQLEITPGGFGEQMQFLADHGYGVATLTEALAGARTGQLPDRTVVLTFDDGTLDFWQFARPILDRHGFRATLFVVTDFVGGRSTWDQGLGEPARPLLNWEQITCLRDEGHEIGSHTRSHRVLTELGDDEVRDELSGSRDALASRLGAAPTALAYPRGFFEPRHERMAHEAGYSAACAVVLKWRDILRGGSFALRRITVKGDEPLSRFRMRLGAARWLASAA